MFIMACHLFAERSQSTALNWSRKVSYVHMSRLILAMPRLFKSSLWNEISKFWFLTWNRVDFCLRFYVRFDLCNTQKLLPKSVRENSCAPLKYTTDDSLKWLKSTLPWFFQRETKWSKLHFEDSGSLWWAVTITEQMQARGHGKNKSVDLLWCVFVVIIIWCKVVSDDSGSGMG